MQGTNPDDIYRRWVSYGGVVLGNNVSRPGKETAVSHPEILVFWRPFLPEAKVM